MGGWVSANDLLEAVERDATDAEVRRLTMGGKVAEAFECGQCDRVFNFQRGLTRHVNQSHGEDRPTRDQVLAKVHAKLDDVPEPDEPDAPEMGQIDGYAESPTMASAYPRRGGVVVIGAAGEIRYASPGVHVVFEA